jgi:V/A-type H+-transporting ATPase subunit E
VANAKAKAKDLMAHAKEQKEKRFEEEKKRIISEAQREASRILAQSSLKARQEILKEQDAVIKEIIAKTKETLAKKTDEKAFAILVKEAVEAFESEEKLRILVSPRDIAFARKVVEGDPGLNKQIAEVGERDCMGGVIAESMDGMVSIDNTFDVRLGMLTPKIMPELGSKLFGETKQ